MDLTAFLLSLRLALATTVVLVVCCTPLALWLAGEASASRKVVQAATALPLVLPPTVLGFYLLVGLGPLTAAGRVLIRVVGHPLSFTFAGLLIGSAVYSLPFAVQPLTAGFRSADPELRQMARSLGASRWQAFGHVTLPLSLPSVLTAAVLVFAHTMGEFGVVLMVGGDIPGVTRTLSISIFDHVGNGEFAAANHLSLLLIVFSFAGLLLLYWRADRATRGTLA